MNGASVTRAITRTTTRIANRLLILAAALTASAEALHVSQLRRTANNAGKAYKKTQETYDLIEQNRQRAERAYKRELDQQQGRCVAAARKLAAVNQAAEVEAEQYGRSIYFNK